MACWNSRYSREPGEPILSNIIGRTIFRFQHMNGGGFMYRLLLADDETVTREGILEAIEWDKLGIAEVQSAKNGVQAFETALESIPDILLTDIKMPRMNGIDLAYKIRELNPDCSILIMSGYSEVDYLKSAIRLSAVNFVEKPVEIDKLTQWIRKCVEVQDGIRRNRAYAENHRLFLLNETALALFRNEPGQAIHCLDELYPGMKPARSLCLLVKLFPAQFSADGEKADTTKITGKAAKTLESLPVPFVLGAVNDQTLAVFLFLPEAEDNSGIISKAYESIKSAGEPYELFMGCGEPAESLSLIAQACETASLALDRSFYSKQKRLLRYQNEPTEALGTEELSRIAEVFSEHIRNGDRSEALKLLDSITFRISMHPGTKVGRVVDFYFQLILEVMKQKTAPFSNDTEQIDIRNWVTGCSFLEDIKDCTARFVQDYFDEIYRRNSSSEMEQVLSIIRQQYGMKKLSLQEISRQTYRSPSYICIKFREATGKTFTQYLSEYRVEKSLELLRDKSLKIAYIAERVGFDNGNYFSKTFQKIKGITPLEYRKRFLADQENT